MMVLPREGSIGQMMNESALIKVRVQANVTILTVQLENFAPVTFFTGGIFTGSVTFQKSPKFLSKLFFL